MNEGKWPEVQPRRGQDYWGVLHTWALAALSWADAKQIAAAVSFDMCTRDDAEGFVRGSARNMLARVDNAGIADVDQGHSVVCEQVAQFRHADPVPGLH